MVIDDVFNDEKFRKEFDNTETRSKDFLKKVNIGDKVEIQLFNSNGVHIYNKKQNKLIAYVVSIEYDKSISGLCWASYLIGLTKRYSFDMLNKDMGYIEKENIDVGNIRKYKIIKKGAK